MFRVSLVDHVKGLKQIFLDVHPVTGRGPWRVGYCDPRTGDWSLLHTHGLSESQINEVERQLRKLLSEFSQEDSGGERQATG